MLSKLISQVEKLYWTHYVKKHCTRRSDKAYLNYLTPVSYLY